MSPDINDLVTVLVAEDQHAWRKSFSALLGDLGYNVIEAVCGDELRIKARQADVIVSDISMPMSRRGPEVKTAGLDVLMELQQASPAHTGISYAIVRSIWSQDKLGEKYKNLPIKQDRWCSRYTPAAHLVGLIRATPISKETSDVKP